MMGIGKYHDVCSVIVVSNKAQGQVSQSAFVSCFSSTYITVGLEQIMRAKARVMMCTSSSGIIKFACEVIFVLSIK